MIFVKALLAYLIFAVLLGAGLLALSKGSGPALFIVGTLVFLFAFSKFGCLSSHD